MSVTTQNVQPHGRIIIRKRLKEILKDSVDINHKKMFFSKPHPKFSEELPCLLIYFTDETLDHQNIVPRNYKRDTLLVTEVQMQTNASIDHFVNSDNTINENYEDIFLDSRAYEIERAIGADRYLGLKGIVNDIVLMREQPIDISYAGEVNVSAMRIFWNIVWRDTIFETGALDEFLRFDSDYNLQNGAEAKDEVTIREE